MVQFDKTNDKEVEKILIHKARQLENRHYRSLYVNVGMIGILGGLIIIPIVIGIFVGGWLDRQFEIENISWRLNLMLVGFIFGLINAYLWVRYEGIQKADEQYRKEQERIKEKENDKRT